MMRISRIIQIARDALLIIICLVMISTSIGPGKEISNYLLAGISGVILILSVVSTILNAFKVERKRYFRGNAIFQLLVGIFLLGLFPPLGIIIVAFNSAALVTLRERKTLEERMKHPPRPITKRYRALVGAGVLAMLVAISVSWLNAMNFPLIGVYLRMVDLSSAASLVSNTMAEIFGFLALVAAPFSFMMGLLGLFKRTFAWVSGILAVIVGTGWIASMTSMAGLGAYVFIFGGVLVLVAPIVAK